MLLVMFPCVLLPVWFDLVRAVDVCGWELVCTFSFPASCVVLVLISLFPLRCRVLCDAISTIGTIDIAYGSGMEWFNRLRR